MYYFLKNIDMLMLKSGVPKLSCHWSNGDIFETSVPIMPKLDSYEQRNDIGDEEWLP